jgi:hypothetical protein
VKNGEGQGGKAGPGEGTGHNSSLLESGSKACNGLEQNMNRY